MKIYAISNSDNKLSFYIDSGQTTIPENAFEVSEKQWVDCMQNPTKYIVENSALKIAPNWVEPIVKEPLPVVDKKAVAISNLEKATTIASIKTALITYINST